MNISSVNIYPIKSLKGISLDFSTVEKRGLRFDRRWMLTDKDGMFFTQREVPRMAVVSVAADESGLTVSADGIESLRIPAEPDTGEYQTVTIWQSEPLGIVYSGIVNEWFSEVLGRKCQLVLMPEKTERHVSSKFDTGDDIVSFADGYPLLLLGEASVAELNERLHDRYHGDEYGEKLPLPMNRFRPNVVVQGSEPFEEDKWATIRIGEAMFRVVKPCARCVMTTVDQAKGEFDGKEPMKTLATFRLAKQAFPETFEDFGHTPNAVLVGENLIPENPGVRINVGDRLEVIERRR